MKQWLKRNIGPVYVVILTAVLAIWLLNSDELPEMIRTLGQLEVKWVWIAFGCIMGYLLMRAGTLHFYLHSRGCAPKFYDTLMVSGIGQFYSAITPSASGGQPMQVLAMHHRGIPVSIATAAVSIKFVGFQLAFLLTGGALWATHVHLVSDQLGPVRWLVVLGYLVNSLLIFAVLMAMVNRSIIDRLVDWAIRMGAKFHLIRDQEKARGKAEHLLDEYRQSLLTLKNRPMDAVVIFLMSLAQVLLLMVVVVCLYHAFRLSGVDDLSLLTLQFLLFITAAFVPLPGAAGAQEGGFFLFFRDLIPQAQIVTLMFCWRFFTYYLLLIVGLIAVISDAVIRKVRRWRDGGDPND
ncbi:flippase-like domain-containing protein [Eubacteriales bacterium OttesenSCG-928-N13]|nr:flippase-like domain-containing protein [Eubacteriales bacterium OttesenSCG-928-N13]